MDSFIDYVLDFYGPDGIYKLGFTREQVVQACGVRISDPRFSTFRFDGDSIDREIVRDIVLEQFYNQGEIA